ncbi:hypothetical protein DFS33DRAFT_1428067 [Desarmillaria ectypa]|nr:hypothetical protein DFS33DRAFT_1428067 [Desarmillaria ectypa]
MSDLRDTLIEGAKTFTALGKDFIEFFTLAVHWRLDRGKKLISSARWYAIRKASASGRTESTLWTGIWGKSLSMIMVPRHAHRSTGWLLSCSKDLSLNLVVISRTPDFSENLRVKRLDDAQKTGPDHVALNFNKEEKRVFLQFPPELVLEILKYVKRCDFDSLFNCCLVSRAWRRLAQPFVFPDLRLSLDAKCALWIERLEQAPHLAGYLKGLDLWGSGLADDDDANEENLFLEEPNLSSLTLSYLTSVESSEVSHVVFEEEKDLLGFFSPMVQLKQLSVSSLYFDCSSADYATAAQILRGAVDPVPKSLQSLNVTFNDATLVCIVMWLLGGTFDLSGITDLAVSWNHILIEDQSHLLDPTKTFLSTVGPGIKKLQFCILLHLAQQRG